MGSASGDVEELRRQVAELESALAAQERRQAAELEALRGELLSLAAATSASSASCAASAELSAAPATSTASAVAATSSGATPAALRPASGRSEFVRRVEWTVDSFSQKRAGTAQGVPLWSPEFSIAGIDGVRLEFFPNGRENTTHEGFCSLFLWCPGGVRVKYQLFVGSFYRAPEEDTYAESVGHGHSNFCPVLPEVDAEKDSIVLGVVLHEVTELMPNTLGGLSLYSLPLEAMMGRELDVVSNKGVGKVVWTISKISGRLKQLPRGASMYSPLFTAGGIREILLEFYPNGSAQTTKEGFCSFYVRAAPGVSMVVTLIVGSVRKGPIRTKFDNLSGKGLPEFCYLPDQIDEKEDSLQVGLELKAEPRECLELES
eukprot:TRINITY_DN17274_c0_g1_i1.p1 TRINITY_DN17274_c0_g1~~TRINITY_DN17274_c0_g1_i1.p1  ORF type:complete len:374 (+),score=78.34 TRINITY_DN17274_c0_g1_i1:156-1277(+)